MGAILGQSYEETVDYFEYESLGRIAFRTPVAALCVDLSVTW